MSTLNGQSPEMQLAELREYASRRGWEIFGEYVDSGISGSKESRPELNRLMSGAHRRHFDVVLERSRLSRKLTKDDHKTLHRPCFRLFLDDLESRRQSRNC